MNRGDERNNNNKGSAGQQVKNALDKFPEGIHVLAVDDDATCLLWLENLLLECNYRATTTMYARDALDMLRQNKGTYDLVITDVQMPEIDGFQLLETIGLEMDLPVIMLSMYNDPDYVERGVVHGAVDYLIKPVRREEIRNIWQHVLRRGRGIAKGKRVVAKPDSLSLEGVNGPVTDSTVSGGEISTRKRGGEPSDKDDEDYEDEDDSERDNDEQTSQKRPRVVWTPDLHKKFVLAVNQLGMDKAVPKKILHIMDVGGLTRENVASHLQKYRMYLKRISDGNQQPMFGSLGRRNSLEAMNNYHQTSSLPSSLLSGYPPSLIGTLGGRPNSITGVNFLGISSSDLIKSGQNLRNSIRPLARLNPNGILFQNGNSFQGGFEQDSSQAGKTMGSICGFNSALDPTGFGFPGNFADPKAVMTGSCSSSGLMFSAASQFSQTNVSSGSGVFKFEGAGGSSSGEFLNHNGTPDSWKSLGQVNGTFTNDPLLTNNNATNRNGISSTGIQPQPVTNAANNGVHGGNVTQRWDNGKLNEFNQEMSAVFGSLNPIMKANGNKGIGSSGMGMDQNQNPPAVNGGDFMGLVNGTIAQNGILGNIDRFTIPEQANLPQDDYIPNNIETMDDIVNSMIERENNGGPSTMFDEEINFDDYSPGSGL